MRSQLDEPTGQDEHARPPDGGVVGHQDMGHEGGAVRVIDEELRRRDAEAALADLYNRVLEVERLLHETRSQAADAIDATSEVARELAGARERIVDLTNQLAAARADLAEERSVRYEAQSALRAVEQTKTFRVASIPRRIYAIVRGWLRLG